MRKIVDIYCGYFFLISKNSLMKVQGRTKCQCQYSIKKFYSTAVVKLSIFKAMQNPTFCYALALNIFSLQKFHEQFFYQPIFFCKDFPYAIETKLFDYQY